MMGPEGFCAGCRSMPFENQLMKFNNEHIKSTFLGQAIGDALGVPVEFKSREYLKKNPVEDYLGYLCWNQPPGTFSDDTSMMLCTTESLCSEFNLNDIADKFIQWYRNGYWGPHNELFDIGGTTRRSLDRIIEGEDPKFSGEFFAENNGNGSLMRILLLVFFLSNEPDMSIRFQKIKEISSITHAHLRSVLACFIFVEFGIKLLSQSKERAYKEMIIEVKNFIEKMEFNQDEIEFFDKVLKDNISDCDQSEISSEGYVLDSLESSIWCLLTSNSYRDSVLKAVNLGGDTDTTGAINRGLAGLYYGITTIPEKWINELARKEDIIELSKNYYFKLKKTA